MNVEIYQLTESEEALIDKHLTFYRELTTGKRQPTTEAQKHFAIVFQGRAKAETEHEIAYAKYLRLEALKRDAESRMSEGIPKYEEGFPRPGWSAGKRLEKDEKRGLRRDEKAAARRIKF